MWLSQRRFLLLVFSAFLLFPVAAQAGDTLPSWLSLVSCQLVESDHEIEREYESPAIERPVVALVQENVSPPTWSFDYTPRVVYLAPVAVTKKVEQQKKQIRPIVFQKFSRQLLTTSWTISQPSSKHFQRQFAFAILDAVRPVESAKSLMEFYNDYYLVGLKKLESRPAAKVVPVVRETPVKNDTQVKSEPSTAEPGSITLPKSWGKDLYWDFYESCDHWNLRLSQLKVEDGNGDF